MQYIQLQGQVASDLTLPANGNHNLFIDTSDNFIKAKDANGNVYSGVQPLVEVTRDAIDILVTSGSLIPGTLYKITNAASRSYYDAREWGYNSWTGGGGNEIQDGGTTVILQATTNKTLSKRGVGLFYVPKYENPNALNGNYKTWDNTHRIYFYGITGGRFTMNSTVTLYSDSTENSTTAYLEGSFAGQTDGYVTFRLGNNDTFFQDPNNLNSLQISTQGIVGYIDGVDYTSSYAPGDKVIYGGRVWQNLSGSIGYKTGGWPASELLLNSEDWAPVAFNETDYTLEAHTIEYEFEYDNISYRSDGVNEVYSDWKWWDDVWGYNMVKFFPWGHHGVERASISNSYLNSFVNFPYDTTAWNVKFEDGGGFNAHTWGKQSSFRNIQGNKGAHFTGNDFGRGTVVYDIKLGIDSYMNSIRTCDNNTRSNDQIYEVTLGNNANFSSVDMYYGSYIQYVEADTETDLTGFSMYEYSAIRNLKLDINAYFGDFNLYEYSEIKYVNLGINSYIEYFDLLYSSCLKRTTLGTDAYMSSFEVGINSFIRQVNLSERAYIQNFTIGGYSNLQNIDLGAYTYMNNLNGGYSTNFENIRLDAQSYIYNVQLGYSSGLRSIEIAPGSSLYNINGSSFTGSYVQAISIGPYSEVNGITLGTNAGLSAITVQNDAYFGSIVLEENASITDVNFMGDSEAGSVTICSGSSMQNFQIGMNSGFGGIIVSQSAALNRFELGVNESFTGQTFTSSLSDITLNKGFKNLNNTVTQSLDAAHGDFGNPLIDLTNRNLITVDISGTSTPYSFDLPDGTYEGQEITFILRTDGTHSITPDQINIWSQKLLVTGTIHGVIPPNGSSWYAIKPFARPDSNGTYNIWTNCTKAIWTNGMWVTNAEAYND